MLGDGVQRFLYILDPRNSTHQPPASKAAKHLITHVQLKEGPSLLYASLVSFPDSPGALSQTEVSLDSFDNMTHPRASFRRDTRFLCHETGVNQCVNPFITR